MRTAKKQWEKTVKNKDNVKRRKETTTSTLLMLIWVLRVLPETLIVVRVAKIAV